MNNETEDDFQKEYIRQLEEEEREELTNNADTISVFKKFCFDRNLQLNDSNFKYIQTIGIIADYPNIVQYLTSDFTKDKEGLIEFKLLCKLYKNNRFAQGLLYDKNFILMAHPFFRRSFYDGNNFAPRFIEFFWNLNDIKIDSYIALDYNRVRINVDNSVYKELDKWYGASFSKIIDSINDDVVKIRPPMDLGEHHISFIFSDAYCLDIKWATKGAIKSFQAEEFKTDKIRITINSEEYYPVRYIHAEFDLENQCFRHFDGAVHLYTSEEYYRRRDSDFNYNSKNNTHIKTISEKLFKFNGNIDIDTWIKFTSHFFAGNPLVFEYFEGSYPTRILEILEIIRKKKLENN